MRDLHPLEKYTRCFSSIKIICIFDIFIELANGCALLMQGTHRLLLSVAVQWLVRQESNNFNGCASRKIQEVNTATEKQAPTVSNKAKKKHFGKTMTIK